MSAPLEVCCPDCGAPVTATMQATSIEPQRTITGQIWHLNVTASGIATHRCAVSP